MVTSINGFDLDVRTNYIPLAENKTPLFTPIPSNSIGLIPLDDGRRELLGGDTIVFRDIMMSVYGAHAGRNFVGMFGIGGQINRWEYAVKGQVVNSTQYAEKMFTDIKANIEKVMKEAQARPGGSAGLTFSDLEKIVKFFNYVKGE